VLTLLELKEHHAKSDIKTPVLTLIRLHSFVRVAAVIRAVTDIIDSHSAVVTASKLTEHHAKFDSRALILTDPA
jgi:hypothetical protein